MYAISYFCLDCNNKFGTNKIAKREVNLIKKNYKRLKS